MKAGIHPNYQPTVIKVRLRRNHRDRLDPPRHHRRDLLEVPPLLHRQAEAGRHQRPC